MATMKALVKHGSRVSLRAVQRPTLRNPDDVLVRVVLAGVCRTDLYVAEGRVPAPDPLILGHEFSALIEEAGPAVAGLRRGDRVAVMPVIPCRACACCAAGRETTCLRRSMLGVDRDGAFAEFVSVPGHCVHRLPENVPFQAGAYAEPVAAALAVLNAGIQPDQVGLIQGRNRFSELIERVLRAHGFSRITVFDPAAPGGPPPANSFDFAIETSATTETLAELVRAVRPHGTIILKSRQPSPVGLDFTAAILKELSFRAVNYGPFRKGIGLLAEGRIRLDGLLGPVYPLDDFDRVFALARRSESSKLFFALAVEHVWDR